MATRLSRATIFQSSTSNSVLLMSISMQIIHPGQLLTPAIRVKQLFSRAISVIVFLSDKPIVSRLSIHAFWCHACTNCILLLIIIQCIIGSNTESFDWTNILSKLKCSGAQKNKIIWKYQIQLYIPAVNTWINTLRWMTKHGKLKREALR